MATRRGRNGGGKSFASLPLLEQWNYVKRIREISGVIAIYGQTGSGKTTAVRALLYACRRRFCDILLFSSTNSATKDIRGIPENKMFDTSENGLEEYMDVIHDALNAAKTRRKRNTKLDKVKLAYETKKISKQEYERLKQKYTYGKATLLIFDDAIFKSNDIGGKIFQQLAKAGRHYDVVTLILVQEVKSIPDSIRTNALLSIVFNVCGGYQLLHNNVFQGFESYTDFRRCLDKQTVSYSCIIKDQFCTYRADVGKSVYYYWKPPETTPETRLGTHAFWATCQEMLDDSKSEERERELQVVDELHMQQSRIDRICARSNFKHTINAPEFTTMLHNKRNTETYFSDDDGVQAEEEYDSEFGNNGYPNDVYPKDDYFDVYEEDDGY